MTRALAAGLLLVGACTQAPDPGSEPPDASPPGDACLVSSASLSGLDPITMSAEEAIVDGKTVYRFTADLDQAPARDVFLIQLRDGHGVFAASPPAPGTFPLTGAETALDTCGACVNVIADLRPMIGPSKIYMAASGTMTLRSLIGGTDGTLEGVTLRELDLQTLQPAVGGCTIDLPTTRFVTSVPP